MMLAGYDNEHSGNCYRMYNPVTSRVVITQDVIWVGMMFYTRLPHKLDHKSMPVGLVPISKNPRKIEDESMQTLEVITRIVPVSDKRGTKRQMPSGQLTGQDLVMQLGKSLECTTRQPDRLSSGLTWQQLRTRMMIPRTTIVLGIDENEERVFEDICNKFIKLVNVRGGIGGGFSNTQEL
jgi:hypothetical protein